MPPSTTINPYGDELAERSDKFNVDNPSTNSIISLECTNYNFANQIQRATDFSKLETLDLGRRVRDAQHLGHGVLDQFISLRHLLVENRLPDEVPDLRAFLANLNPLMTIILRRHRQDIKIPFALAPHGPSLRTFELHQMETNGRGD